MKSTTKIINEMMAYYKGDPKRINHFLKVHGYAGLICEIEKLDSDLTSLIEMTAIVHDIGIKISEEKYGSSAGKYQEIEGPGEARKLLSTLDIDNEVIERCCWLIAHHHSYGDIKDLDHQILVEADFLVNIYEDGMSEGAIQSVRDKIFKTEAGKTLLEQLFL